MKVKDIANRYHLVSTPAPGDGTVTIADLAKYTKMEGHLGQHHSGAFHAIIDEWKYELVEAHNDFYDGFTIDFKDGSNLSYYV